MRYVVAFLSISMFVWGVLALDDRMDAGLPLICAGVFGGIVYYLITQKSKMGE